MTYNCFSHHRFFESALPCQQYNTPAWLPFAIFGSVATLLFLTCCLFSRCDRSHAQHTIHEESFGDNLSGGVLVASYA